MWRNLAEDIAEEFSPLCFDVSMRSEPAFRIIQRDVSLPPRACARCGELFEVSRADQKYCPEHSKAGVGPRDRVCGCGKAFVARRRDQRSCSTPCAVRRCKQRELVDSGPPSKPKVRS